MKQEEKSLKLQKAEEQVRIANARLNASELDYMSLKLIPQSYGLSGALGVFALNAVIGGLIGGAMLIAVIIKISLKMIRLLLGDI